MTKDDLFYPQKQELRISSLVELKHFNLPPNFFFPREKHEFWKFVYVESGVALVTVGDHKYLLEKGEVIFQKPGEFHALQSVNDNHVRAIASAFVCESPYMQFFEYGVFALTKDEQKYLYDALNEYCSEEVSGKNVVSPNDEDICQGNFATSQLVCINLELLLIHLYRRGRKLDVTQFESTQCFNFENIGDQITAYLKSHLTQKLTLKQISDQFGYSISQLEKIYKSQTGQKIIDSFIEMKMNEALRVLQTREMNVSQIAAMLGYDNIAYFYRLFKKRFGVTPTEYVKSLERE